MSNHNSDKDHRDQEFVSKNCCDFAVNYAPPYEDLTRLNTERLLLDTLGRELLAKVAEGYLEYLQTSGAIHEANGDYALGIFSSGWCRHLDQASRRLCGTEDNRKALAGGKWLCHEACWKASKISITSGQPADIACPGGIRIYSVPIKTDDRVIGAANLGYGTPPRDLKMLEEIADLYKVSPKVLERLSEEYAPRSFEMIEMAKACLGTTARLIGSLVQQKQDKEKFSRQEKMWEKIFEAIGQPVLILDSHYRILRANRTAVDASASVTPDLIGKNCFEIFHQTDQPPAQCPAAQLIRNGMPHTAQMKVEALDRTFLVSCAALKDPDGRVEKIIHVGTDITDRKRDEDRLKKNEARYHTLLDAHKKKEAQLRQSEARFRAAFEKASIAMALTLPDGRLSRVNRAFCEMLGYDAATLATMTWAEITHPDDLAETQKLVQSVLAGQKEGMRIEKRYLRSDGRVVWADVNTVMVRHDDGSPNHFITHIFDISKRKEIEGHLQHQGELMQTIMDNIPLMVVLTEADGRMRWVNKCWEKTTGYCSAEARDRKIWSRLYPDPQYLEMVRKFILRADGKWGDFKTRIRNGTVIDTVWANVVLSDGTNIGIGEDVTERRQAEKDQKALEAQLIQAQKMESIGRLAGGMAHDFNNLLSIVLGYSELMAEDIAQDHPNHQVLMEIHEAGMRARELIRQLLAFARKQVLEVKKVDLNQVVTGFEKMLRRLIGEDVELKLALSSEFLPVKADVAQIEQVLLNLAVNARDAMPKGGGLRIETYRETLSEEDTGRKADTQPGIYACMAVSDTGMGMDAATQANIFDPFFTTKSKDKGTGLGLSTVYGIVKQHQGNIWVYSEVGYGTIFKIYLPCVLEKQKEVLALSKPAAVEPFQFKTAVILVIEDDPAVRLLIGKVLSQVGYTVLDSSDTTDAINTADRHTGAIDLALVDVIMPGMSGPEVYERISRMHPETKVLFMSGYAQESISHQGVLKEGIQFISKPFVIQELLMKVRQIIDQ